ncbi:lasso peptide biosynthesis B2 protein [Streptomyces sp. NRRL F-5123]|uniref:lasso peptide biosynthesis B2 protein n=1 Tax=Streptomyces sp. NRRL F-5123 TaxID=1463856 RepID=UPI0004E111BA|nr:lasso peptide biosynthesis B2 protein [Streptomyces sp. NRRL F-5123]
MPDLDLLSLPGHVRAADFGHVLVLVDYRTGQVQGLLPAAAARFRDAARAGTARPLAGPLAEGMLAAGLLAPALPATTAEWPVTRAAVVAASWGSAEHPAGVVRPAPAPVRSMLAAAGALAAVAVVKAAGEPGTAMLRVVRAVGRAVSTCRRPATPEEAEAAVRTVRAAGWFSPGRTACLEESASVALLLAGRSLSVTWCHGIAADPVRLHAWVQTEDGAPVAEPPSTLAYTPVLTLGARHHHQP